MKISLTTVRIIEEHDVVSARQRARDIAAALGFDTTGQTRLATAVSEIARNAYVYAGGGRVDFAIDSTTPPPVLSIEVIDTGPGVSRLADVLRGRYTSATGMGLGIVGARDRLQERGLARAVGAEHGDDGAFRHVEADAFERRDRSVIGLDIAEFEEGHQAPPR